MADDDATALWTSYNKLWAKFNANEVALLESVEEKKILQRRLEEAEAVGPSKSNSAAGALALAAAAAKRGALEERLALLIKGTAAERAAWERSEAVWGSEQAELKHREASLAAENDTLRVSLAAAETKRLTAEAKASGTAASHRSDENGGGDESRVVALEESLAAIQTEGAGRAIELSAALQAAAKAQAERRTAELRAANVS